MEKRVVEVRFSHDDPGNCRKYYRTVKSGQLLCLQEEAKDYHVWYSCVDDDCWQEPDFSISLDKVEIVVVKAEETIVPSVEGG